MTHNWSKHYCGMLANKFHFYLRMQAGSPALGGEHTGHAWSRIKGELSITFKQCGSVSHETAFQANSNQDHSNII